ncbi:hypothetical protein VAA_02007 [Vibrio anguillarum 775]|nr:hypothetical protein VAA_02007 [Vibrio anguillarum 775]
MHLNLLKRLLNAAMKNLPPFSDKPFPRLVKGMIFFATAQTGTGKTAAFALPVIQHLLDSGKQPSPKTARGLILAPTRELVAQIAQNIKDYVKYTKLSVAAVYGGNKMSSQVRQLEMGVDILVATPGRLEEHLSEGNVSLANLEFLVFDEADRILDMGFINPVRKIMLEVETSPQIMMFSATTSTQLNQLAGDILRKPKRINADRANTTAATVAHVVYPVDQERKTELLSELIGRKNWQQVLVFVNYKETANEVVKELKLDGIKAVLCHGDKAQSARRRALEEFKEGKVRVMVATDVAARGLDIVDLPHVVNYDMPFLAEDYVHRIGRTGRAGKQGHAVSFVSREEELTVVQVENLIQQRIRRVEQPGYEPKQRDAYIEKLHTKAAYKDRQGRRNNPNDEKPDQASAERRLNMMNRLKNRKK